jgi:hypothetical protein
MDTQIRLRRGRAEQSWIDALAVHHQMREWHLAKRRHIGTGTGTYPVAVSFDLRVQRLQRAIDTRGHLIRLILPAASANASTVSANGLRPAI